MPLPIFGSKTDEAYKNILFRFFLFLNEQDTLVERVLNP